MSSVKVSISSPELLQMLSIGWLEFLADGKITASNIFANKLLRCPDATTLQEVIFWKLILDAPSRAQVQRDIETLNDVTNFETEVICLDGNVIWVRLNIHALNDTTPPVFGCTMEDITSQKKHQRENLELHSEINKQRRLADSLGRMMLSTSLLHDLPSLLKLICSEATAILNMSSAQIWLLQDGALNGEIAFGTGPDVIKGLQIHPSDESHIGILALNKKMPLYLYDLNKNGGMIHESFGSLFPIKSILAAPLFISGRAIGVLILFDEHQNHMFDGDDLELSLQLGNQIAITIENVRLVDDLKVANKNIAKAYDATLAGWAKALELRDLETEGHTQRVARLTIELAKLFHMDDEEITQINRGALLHDIGKMGIPDGILLKPGPLDELEQAVMRRHPVYAYEMLKSIEYLRPALDIPHFHHERWDGNGYPQGLKGEEIPLHARIFAIVDVWDALISTRPYRKAWNHETALEFIRSQAGKHFDPDVLEKFLKIAPQWK